MRNLEPTGILTIGVLARRTGLRVSAIRYDEEIGLISKAARRPSRHRVCGSDVQEVLTLVRNSRDFGFSIDPVRTRVALSSNTQLACDASRDIAQEHLNAVKVKLAQLHPLETNLTHFIQACTATCVGGPAPNCTILKDIGSSRSAQPASRGCC